jgi:ABC-type branched-subunit amino acid transport system permease subunit
VTDPQSTMTRTYLKEMLTVAKRFAFIFLIHHHRSIWSFDDGVGGIVIANLYLLTLMVSNSVNMYRNLALYLYVTFTFTATCLITHSLTLMNMGSLFASNRKDYLHCLHSTIHVMNSMSGNSFYQATR